MPSPDPVTAADDPTVPAQLVRALSRHADRPALTDRDLQLSYGDLARFIGAFRGQLRDDGPVAVFGMPGALMAAAAVACVVAGRPFVHLDPAMPQAVLTNIVDELRVGTIVTCQPARPGQLPGHVRLLAAQDCLTGADPGPLRAADVAPTDIIYLVATSGTTGRPKCIPVTHDAACLSYLWRDGFTPYDPTMRVAIYIFAIWEMFRPLRDGASLHFPGMNDLMSPQALTAFLSRHRIDEMLFTPSLFEKTLTAIDPKAGAALPLRRVILNGEVVTPPLAAEARARLPGVALWNLYSICETHDISITDLGDPDTGGSVGVAMPHLRAVVLDDADRPCAPGQTGHLHFEGRRMLGPGYVNRPDETAQRFRTLTLEGRAARLYDTGDQGFVTAEGRIHVLGRVAHMLKLRGHSIQTPELIATMAARIGFGQAIPWVRQIEGQGQVLVFYYTADAAQQAGNARQWGIGPGWQRMPQALAGQLQTGLPRYCVPGYLVRLDEIPINPVSGKCDFKALPDLPADPGLATPDQPGDARVAVARLLGCAVEEVDPRRSFHDQGGDSLMAVDLLLALEQAYGRRVDFEWALNLPLARLHDLLTQTAEAGAGPGRFDRPGLLLTGATGFLGGHVLAQAVAQLPPGQVVYCLVRPRNADPAARLARLAGTLGLSPDRIVAVPGSLDAPRLGLQPAAYAALTAQLEAVIHCAATVNLALDRAQMEAWSQAGIATIVQLCRDADAPLTFSSSTSIFPGTGGPFPETLATPFEGISGYGAAKIAAEHAIAGSGIAARIVRLPSLYDLQAPNPRDIYETILTACRLSGRLPEGLCFPMTDVRAAARLLAARPWPEGVQICNLTGDRPVTGQGRAGHERLPMAAWLDAAPLSPSEHRLLAQDPTILRADAVFDTARARSLWQALGLGGFDAVSDPGALMDRRLPAHARAAATTAIRH